LILTGWPGLMPGRAERA